MFIIGILYYGSTNKDIKKSILKLFLLIFFWLLLNNLLYDFTQF